MNKTIAKRMLNEPEKHPVCALRNGRAYVGTGYYLIRYHADNIPLDEQNAQYCETYDKIFEKFSTMAQANTTLPSVKELKEYKKSYMDSNPDIKKKKEFPFPLMINSTSEKIYVKGNQLQNLLEAFGPREVMAYVSDSLLKPIYLWAPVYHNVLNYENVDDALLMPFNPKKN